MFHHRRITPAAYLAQAGILALVAANAKRATTALDIRAECDRGRDASMTAYDYNNLGRAPVPIRKTSLISPDLTTENAGFLDGASPIRLTTVCRIGMMPLSNGENHHETRSDLPSS